MLLHLFLPFVSLAPMHAATAAVSAIAEPQPRAAPAVRQGLTGDLGLFPPASGDLDLSWEPEGPGLTSLELLARYAELTGQELVIDRETRKLLQADPVSLERPVTVPAAGVQSFVEALLADRYALSVAGGPGLRLLSVHALHSPVRFAVSSRARFVPSDRLELLRAHPAVMFSTLLELPNLDVRTLSNSLRSIILDPNVQTVIPVADAALVIGFGPWVANLAEQLRTLDAASEPARSSVVVHELLRLAHADAQEVAHLIEGSLAGPRTQRRGEPQEQRERRPRVQAYARLNALWVTCHQDELDEVRRLVGMIDRE